MSSPEQREIARLQAALRATCTALTCAAQATVELIAAPASAALPLGVQGSTAASAVLEPTGADAQSEVIQPARFERIGADGSTVLSGGVAAIDHTTALMWDVATLDAMPFDEAEQACRALRVAGFDDWRLPTLTELESLRDLSRCDPAIDTGVFPDTKSSAYWTSTPAAASPEDCAWLVSFRYGSSDWGNRNLRNRVRAVRSVARARQ